MSQKQAAEQATGIRESRSGIGTLYSDGGVELTSEQAYDTLREGHTVEVPNAGAGSYEAVFRTVGFSEAKAVEQSSSAGDWTFGVKDGDEGDWYPAFQTNRHPYYGFAYSVDFGRGGFESFEQLCKCLD